MANARIANLLAGNEPLTTQAAEYLLDYKEEDDQLDYKLSIDGGSEKDWLELTKDVSAFANTFGGVFVIGVKNKEKEIVGLPPEVCPLLDDANNILQKLNRHLDPHISRLRSKVLRVRERDVAFVLVPQSVGITHLISKDAEFTHPSGKKQLLLRQGTFYVRRSASNHLADSRDLDAVVERRVDQFRAALLDKVAKVVKAPADSDVFILKKDPTDKESKRFIIKDSPESLPIKGMSFTVAPEGPEEEIAAWTVLSSGNTSIRPRSTTLWKWFAARDALQLSEDHSLAVFRFALCAGAPAFVWIRGLHAQAIQQAILDSLRTRPPGADVSWMLVVASFLGKTAYDRALSALGEYQDRLGPRQKFPARGPRAEYATISPGPRQSIEECRAEQLRNLNAIAASVLNSNSEPSLTDRWSAQRKDCFLYAQDDKYRRT